MKIVLYKPDDFSASIILRTLYYSTYFEDLEVYISGKIRKDRIARYSRVPVYELKNKVCWSLPIIENVYRIDPKSERKIFNIEIPETLLVDFSGEFSDRFKGVSCLGISNLAYEVVSVIYYLIIQKHTEHIPYLKNIPDKVSIYLCKRLLDFVDTTYPNPRKLLYILQHIYKKYKLVLGLKSYRIEGDFKDFKVMYFIEVFDRRLRKVSECHATFYKNILRVPIFNGKEIEYREFFIDNNRKRVYITQDFYLGKDEEDPIKSFSNLF